MQNKIDLPDDDAALIKVLIQYLYELEYDPKLSSDPAPRQEVTFYGGEDVSDKYHYVFPHTCPTPYCPGHHMNVCPHHTCIEASCDDSCEDYDLSTGRSFRYRRNGHDTLAKLQEMT